MPTLHFLVNESSNSSSSSLLSSTGIVFDEAVVDELGDVLHVLRAFETVADDVAVLVDDAAVVEGVDDMDVVGRRRFQMDVVLHGLFQHEREVARLGAVAIVVRTLVVDLRHRHVEHALGAVDLLGDLRQVGDFERSSVLFDQFHQRNVVEIQLVVLDGELILREIERSVRSGRCTCLSWLVRVKFLQSGPVTSAIFGRK